MYIPTSTPAGHLFAIDVVSGEFKWVFAISQITYGGGALVAPDGTIYQCVRNATINNVYAINPNGTQKWAVKLDAAIGAFPALSADGVLYCLTNKSTLYALDASSGAIKWQQSLDGAVLWLLIKPEMFMQVQVQPFILLNRIKSRIGNWKK